MVTERVFENPPVHLVPGNAGQVDFVDLTLKSGFVQEQVMSVLEHATSKETVQIRPRICTTSVIFVLPTFIVVEKTSFCKIVLPALLTREPGF